MNESRRIVICGAAGRDFHDFNVLYREDPDTRVVAFTATQIPGIESRRYPAALAGSQYPDGIAIRPESDLETICAEQAVDEVIFAYSDVPNEHVMQLGARALSAGADFTLPGPRSTMLESKVPVISVCAVRTGCGKSQIARFLTAALSARSLKPAAIRHPMPYGDLEKQIVQRFASLEDLTAQHCTLEEREEYEPHIEAGGMIYAGADYGAILAAAEEEANIIVWDGGNNDFSFYRPDFSIAVVDALRPDQLDTHHPGGTVLRMADLIVVNKTHAASTAQLEEIIAGLDRLRPETPRVLAASPVTVEDSERLRGARVLVVEDGPTITHGGMPIGAGHHAATALGVRAIVDPRHSAAPDIAAVYARFPHIGPVLPAMGYSEAELTALVETINGAAIDFVVAGTPIDLAVAIEAAGAGALAVPVVRARYAYQDAQQAGEPGLADHLDRFLATL